MSDLRAFAFGARGLFKSRQLQLLAGFAFYSRDDRFELVARPPTPSALAVPTSRVFQILRSAGHEG
jgi:hypothetical protein